jgi:spore germination protein GerM
MRHLIAAAALLATAACGVQPTSIVSAGGPAVARRYVPPTTVYFLRDGRLTPVQRRSLPGAPEVALGQLFQGPTRLERVGGLRTYIPPGAIVVPLSNDTVPTNPPKITVSTGYGTFFVSLPRRMTPPRALAQIVCTGGAQPGIHTVTLVIGTKRRNRTCASYSSYK